MKTNFLRTLFLMLTGIAVLGIVAAPAIALANQGDLIWDAEAWQGNIHLKAKYKESPENNLIDQSLEVELQHIPPFVTVDVLINGAMIGQMTSNGAGHAQLNLDIFNVQPNAQGRPNGPRIETGDIVTVRKAGSSLSAAFVPRP